MPAAAPASYAQGILSPPRASSFFQNASDLGSPNATELAQVFQTGGNGWAYWWAFNRDPYLAEVRDPGSGAISATWLNGSRPTSGALPLDEEQVHREVVPLLQLRLAKTKDPDLAVGCLMALGKIGEAPRAMAKEHGLTTVESSIRGRLNDSSVTVRNTAIIALGLVGGPRAASLLTGIAEGDPEGAKTLGVARIDRQAKTYALYGLGLIGYRTRRHSERTFVVGRLLAAAESNTEENALGVAAVMGLGWAPLPLEVVAAGVNAGPLGQEATIRRLLALFNSRKTDVRMRAQLPVALARLVQSPTGLEDPAKKLEIAAVREKLRQEVVGRFAQGLGQRGGEKNPTVIQGLTLSLIHI